MLAASWLVCVLVGILLGCPAEAEIQNLDLQPWQLEILPELFG